MAYSLQDWFLFLQRSNQAAAIPLLAGGAAMMIFGWRLWKLCVMASFGLIGAAIGAKLGEAGGNELAFASVVGGSLALLSFWPVNAAVSVLGGVIGAFALTASFRGMGMSGPALWCLGGVTMFGCTAMAYLNRQLVVVFATATLGSALLMSGLARVAMESPSVFGTVRTMIASYGIVLPFMLIVPGVISGFYQLSEIHRARAEL